MYNINIIDSLSRSSHIYIIADRTEYIMRSTLSIMKQTHRLFAAATAAAGTWVTLLTIRIITIFGFFGHILHILHLDNLNLNSFSFLNEIEDFRR